MATATSVSLTADRTNCAICLDVFDNPKSLPCLHAFCLKCLQGYCKDKCPGDEIPCPVCRKAFLIPSDGLGDLQYHVFERQRTVDARKVSSEQVREVRCVVCLEDSDGNSEETATAIVYCVDCKQKLCERCSRPHRKMPGGAHRLKPLGAELEQELIHLEASSCDKHTDKQVELYCHQCNENICVLCYAVQHRNHESGEIPEVAKNFRLRIEANDKQVVSSIGVLRHLLKERKQDLSTFFTDTDKVEKAILQAGDEIKQMHLVDNQTSQLVSELQTLKSDCIKKAQVMEERIQLALVAHESFHTHSRELLDKGRPSDVTRAGHELLDRATELLQNDVTALDFRPPRVTFAPADVTPLTRLNLVGKVIIDSYQNQPGIKHLTYCTTLSLYNLFMQYVVFLQRAAMLALQAL